MRGLLVCSLTLALILLQGCGGNGQDAAPSSSPTSTTVASPSPTASDEAIAFAQQYQVLYRVQREDGLWESAVVSLASRVEAYCADTPRWSARESEEGPWRIYAECEKLQSVPADNPLVFEFLFYSELKDIQPWNYAAHVAQYDYPWNP